LLVFVSVLILTQFLSYQRYVISKNAEQQKVLNEINSVKYRLKTALGHSLSATKTLAFIVGEYGVPKDFNKVAGEILAANSISMHLNLHGRELLHIYIR